MEPDLPAEIAEIADIVQSAASDGQTVSTHSLTDRIAWDQHKARKAIVARRGIWGQMSIARAIPPSGISDRC